MELFTIIGLIISIFGATYTSISALKSVLAPFISNSLATLDDRINDQYDKCETSKHAKRSSKRCQKTMNGCNIVCNIAHGLSVIVFLVCTIFVSSLAITKWTSLSQNGQYDWAPSLIKAVLYANLSFLCVYFISASVFIACNSLVKHNLKIYDERQAKNDLAN